MNTKRNAMQAIMYGAGAGVVASLAMAMYAMIASWAKGTGFFTPLYHIASLLTSGDSMMASMKAAAAGGNFHFVFGTAVVGAVIHMMTGAMYGAVFGLIVSRFHLKLGVLAAAGVVYGAIVFAGSAFVALPVAGTVLGSGDPIKNMAEMAGYGTFFTEHLLFGLALGLLVGLRTRRTPSETKHLSSAHAG